MSFTTAEMDWITFDEIVSMNYHEMIVQNIERYVRDKVAELMSH